jgi:predicted nucleic acid-binding protein
VSTSVEAATYLDASALVKLVVAEGESPALRGYVADKAWQSSSVVAKVEVIRAVRAHGPEAVRDARVALAKVALIGVTESLLDVAADLEGQVLRSLDAIHIAAAQTLGDDLAELVTYDRRIADAARSLGFTVTAPA